MKKVRYILYILIINIILGVILCQEVYFLGESWGIFIYTSSSSFDTANGKDDLFYKVSNKLDVYDTIRENNKAFIHNTNKWTIKMGPEGWVPTSGTAAQIAEAVWYSLKGKDYLEYKITSSTLIENNYWVVTAENRNNGASLYIEIDKYGTILRNIENLTEK